MLLDAGVLYVPPLAGVPTPILERLRSLRWEAGVAYGGGRRWIAASQSKGSDEANGEPDTRGRLRGVSGSNGVEGIVVATRCHRSQRQWPFASAASCSLHHSPVLLHSCSYKLHGKGPSLEYKGC